jgi:hypothetical protein
MNTTSQATLTPPASPMTRRLIGLAVPLAIGGVIAFVFLSLMRLGHATFAIGAAAEMLAFVGGILGWRQRGPRLVVIAQAVVAVLFGLLVLLYLSFRA